MRVRGLFVTGTDTDVGKSVVAAATCAAAAAQGERATAFKPVVTGLDDAGDGWPADHELLAGVTGQAPEEVTTRTFGPAASPHLAAELSQSPIDPATLLAAARSSAARADLLVCEGVGGLLVPLTRDYLVRDLAVDLGLPLVVVARPGLGTINHTLLTIEAARACGLPVAGIVMTPWPRAPDAVAVSNRETVQRLTGVQVSALPATRPDALADAGRRLPVARWLGTRHNERR